MPELRQVGPHEWEYAADPGEEFKCDFCSSRPVVMSFGAGEIRIDLGLTEWASADAWAACAECAPLVMRDDVEGLARRSASMLSTLPMRPSTRKNLERELSVPIRAFMAARRKQEDDAVGKSERHQEADEEECVFCGERKGADSFEDGLRCKTCAEEQDDQEEKADG